MSPRPNEVHKHHHVAAGFIGEKVEPEVTVQQQHGQRRRENGKRRDDQQAGGERRPAEHRHAHVAHAGSMKLEDRDDEVDPCQQGPHTGNFKRPKVVIDADTGRVFELRERRIRQPCGAREFSNKKRDIDEQRPGCGQPEADRVERGKRDVADPELERHDEVHQPDDEGHRNEEDHQGAVGREDLVVMLGRQVARRTEREGLLRPHHDRIGEAAQQHHHREQDVHDPDPLVVDASDPLPPKIREPSLQGNPGEDADDHEADHARCDQRDWLIERDSRPAKLAQHI